MAYPTDTVDDWTEVLSFISQIYPSWFMKSPCVPIVAGIQPWLLTQWSMCLCIQFYSVPFHCIPPYPIISPFTDSQIFAHDHHIVGYIIPIENRHVNAFQSAKIPWKNPQPPCKHVDPINRCKSHSHNEISYTSTSESPFVGFLK